MFLQPYFPEPVTVTGNVGDQPYLVRLRFLRQVVGWHVSLISLLTIAACFAPPPIDWRTSTGALACFLLLHQSVRRLAQQAHWEPIVHALLFLGTGAALVSTAAYGIQNGWPLLCVPFAALGMALYTLLCGRDFSMVGQVVLAGLFMSLCMIALSNTTAFSEINWGITIGLGWLVLFYWVYDLSMIMKRRRPKDHAVAAVDLWYDVLNILTYGPKVIAHWRKFRF